MKKTCMKEVLGNFEARLLLLEHDIASDSVNHAIDAAAQRDLFFDAESYERDHFKSHFTK